MKSSLLFILLFLTALQTFAQNASLRGNLIDSASRQPLIGATVVLQSGDFKAGFVSNEKGAFYFTGLESGSYTLNISMIGYRSIIRIVYIKDNEVLSNLVIAQKTNDIEGVDIKETLIPVKVKGDTTEFTADAFKTNQNANAKDLLGKMPGMQTANGNVKSEGENVQQVLVDGKPFFGQDPQTALSTLPAEVIDKIQVFDDQSDQSKQSGVDDGTRVKTINIVTKINMRNGEFGRAYAGAGASANEDLDPRYSAGTNINIFRGDQKVSILAQVNNINQQNFATEDLLGVNADNSDDRRGGGRYRRGFSVGSDASDFMVNPQNGITQTAAAGLNYQNTFTPKLELSGNYFYNRTNTLDRSNTFQNYFLEGNSSQEYLEYDSSDAINVNHRLNAKLQYKFSEKSSLFIVPTASIQQNDGFSGVNGQTFREGVLSSELDNILNSNLSALRWSNDLMYRYNFDKKGRTFFTSVEIGQSLSKGDKTLDANNSGTISNQLAELNNASLSYEIDLRYTEPLNDEGLGLDFSYELTNDLSDNETRSYDELNERRLIDSLSSSFTNDWMANEFGFGVRKFEKGQGFLVRARYEYATLVNNQMFPSQLKVDKAFHSFRPFALMRKDFKKNNNIFMMYRTSTDAPSAQQLQNVLDNSNPLQLSIGNPNLNRQYEHMVRMRYKQADTKKSKVFYAALNGAWSANYLSSTTYTALNDTLYDGIQLNRGSQLRSFTNLAGYSRYDGFLTWGMPVKKLKSNLNINLSSAYSIVPSLINDVKSLTHTTNNQIGLVLSSNVSKNLDFTVSSETNLNTTNSSVNESINSQFIVQSSKLKLDWILKKGPTVRTSFDHQFYSGLDESLDNVVLLWNLGLGYQVLKKKGEVQLSVFDLLGQNNQISQQFYDSYYEEKTSKVLTRYLMLTFSYNFRKFRESDTPDELNKKP